MMKTQKKRISSSLRPFTLVEILAVISIMAILMALSIGGYMFAAEKMAISSTQTRLQQVASALETLKTKYGYYPRMQDEYALRNEFSWHVNGWKNVNNMDVNYIREYKRLINFGDWEEKFGDEYVLEDAWGNPLKYLVPGEKNRRSFDLVSAGPDEVFAVPYDSEADDILN